MSVTAEFTAMKQRIWDAIDKGLLDAGEDAKDVLQNVIYENVYSYPASYWAQAKRRYDNGGLGEKENMIASVSDAGKSGRYHELQVEDFAGFQDHGPNFRGGFTGTGPEFNTASIGARLDEVVETGDPAWRQPFPRPFYKDAETQLVNGGVVTGNIVSALVDAGFTVEVI